MNIIIKTIPHDQQRYPTAGDWWFEPYCQGKPEEECDLHIRVSGTGNWRYEALVALHELVEVLKCKHDGVSQKEVDEFDIEYEKNRKDGDDSEPGDSPDAPYRFQHCLATGIERIMCAEFGLDWKAYDDALMALS